ncbi:MAG TPA: sigma-54 dependent transcriptional regulator [Terriglobales bacterium]|nr:sigma-54 dependent transcriptional regulator [Terriglobales bacterium]
MSIAASSFCPKEIGGVLVASPNDFLRKRIVETLHSTSWPVEEAVGGADALNKLENSECELLLLDRRLPDLDSTELRGMINLQFPGVDVLMLDGETGRATPPIDPKTEGALHLIRSLEISATNEPTSGDIAAPEHCASISVPSPVEPLPGMVGSSGPMQRVYRMVRLVAARDTAVLVTGDSGSGKELIAQAIHQLSSRNTKPFVVINCAAIPEALLESELFGYVRGAFTGAIQSRVGRIHAAQGGTLFLDEIGEIPLGLQAKLLRFLENGEVQRLGSTDVFRVDVRVVAATNADLRCKVQSGEFRKDLYYRLSVFPIELPQLCDRRSDISALAQHFVTTLSAKPVSISFAALEMLERHDWPGNVRELKHVMERAIILAQDETVIGPEHIVISPAEFRA